MIDPKLIGGRIRELRKKRGLTQSEFASIISVSFQAVSNWERGIAPPDIENLMIIASYFGVLVDSLIAPIGEDIYVGIDGGGTKTEFIAVSRSGCVVKRVTKTGCNPNDIGSSGTESLICEGLDEIIREYPSVCGTFAGIAGATTGNYAEKLQESLTRLYPRINFQVKSDAFNIFALCDKADMALISGTGSVLLVRNGENYSRLGGWGHLFDNAGSAYDIGREAVRHALWCEERRKTPTKLYKMLLKRLNSETVWAHVNAMYSGGRSYIASLATTVFDAYAEGDETAASIIDESARAKDLFTAIRREDINKMSFMFSIDDEEWEDLESDHPTRHIKKIGSVVEVSAVTFPAYDATSINARSKEALENARAAVETAKLKARSVETGSNLLELEKAKTMILGGN